MKRCLLISLAFVCFFSFGMAPKAFQPCPLRQDTITVRSDQILYYDHYRGKFVKRTNSLSTSIALTEFFKRLDDQLYNEIIEEYKNKLENE